MDSSQVVSGEGMENHLMALKRLAIDSGSEPLPQIFTDPMWAETMRYKLMMSQVRSACSSVSLITEKLDE